LPLLAAALVLLELQLSLFLCFATSVANSAVFRTTYLLEPSWYLMMKKVIAREAAALLATSLGGLILWIILLAQGNHCYEMKIKKATVFAGGFAVKLDINQSKLNEAKIIF
jgi:hypothetical protein